MILQNSDYPNDMKLEDRYIDLRENESLQIWQPKQDPEFSEGSLEVHRMRQERKIDRFDFTKEESYKAIQYYIDNDTDTYTV